nr:restriction endonuclease [Actinopolymorpha pittospori]
MGRLTDFDFEAVCKDILEELLDIDLELFSPGPDGGIDLRHLSDHQGGVEPLIVQCKHWLKSGRSALLRHMQNVEATKVRSLRPRRYILATSVGMTPMAKDTLQRSLSPYLKSPADILGLEEIEAILRRSPHIVRSHLRLWLSSSAVLQSLLHKEILIRSRDLVNDVSESLRVFVPNASYSRATDLLERHHACVIAGVPGIGKTTLAQVLAADHLAAGYELIEVSSDIDEINKAWDDDVPQFFYYDDFLGQTSLDDKLQKNEDSRLLRLLKRINKSSNKRFILTTREYILAQAKHRYEILSRYNFNPLTCILDLNEYTSLIRAQILYNHVYFSELPPESKATFADPRVYLPLINHRNFNPRLVSLTFGGSVPADIQEGSEDPSALLMNHFENPENLWSHVVENQLSTTEVSLLELLFSFPAAAMSDLAVAWSSYSSQVVGADGSVVGLRKAIKNLEGTMVRVTAGQQNRARIAYHNPSIRDYMRNHLAAHPNILASLVESAVFFDQVKEISQVSVDANSQVFRLALRSSLPVFREVALRTYQEAASHGDGDHVKRAVDLLRIAHHWGDQDFQLKTGQIIEGLDLDDFAIDGDSLVDLVNEVAASTVPQIRGLAAMVAKSALKWINEDLSDWANSEYAYDLLERLEYGVSSSMISSARDHLDDLARGEIEYFVETGRGAISDLEDVLNWASQVSDPDEFYPGYGLALQALEQEKARRPTRALHSSTEESGEDEAHDEEIARMFSLLTNDQETDRPMQN